MWLFFRYRFKALINQKPLVFWALLFPIILVTFFHFAFAGLATADVIKPFSVAVVGSENSNVVNVMKQIEAGGKKLIKIKFTDKARAKQMLEDKEVEGIITITGGEGSSASALPEGASAAANLGAQVLTEDISLGVNSDGINQILLKEFLDTYKQKTAMIAEAAMENPEILSSGVIDSLDFGGDSIKHLPVSDKAGNGLIISFYSAIAMTCLYGAFISAHSMETLQANQTAAGQRLSVSPFRKSKMLIIDVFICFLLIFVCVIAVMAYMKFILGIEFSSMFGGMLLVSAVGAFVSTAFGYVISLLLKRKTNAKISIIVCVTMLWSALAGMMAPPVKYLIEKHVPYINWINPVALITDGYTALYYYENYDKVISDIGIMAVMFVVLMGFSVLKLRRQQYESL